MTRIGFVRHGCTAWNKEGRAQGWSDVPLDEEGNAQAMKLAYRLDPLDWDVIYSSDLLRARQTAESINQKLQKADIYFDERLRELGGGKVEGTTEAERIEKWGETWRDLDMSFESMEAVYARGHAFWDEVIQKHAGKNILIVSHGSFMKRMLKRLLPKENMDVSLGNCSMTVLEKNKDGWELVLHNCTQHLTDE